MSGTKTQRQTKAKELLEDLRTAAVTRSGDQIAIVDRAFSDEYQRGFQEGYELGQQPEEQKRVKAPNPLKAVKGKA